MFANRGKNDNAKGFTSLCWHLCPVMVGVWLAFGFVSCYDLSTVCLLGFVPAYDWRGIIE